MKRTKEEPLFRKEGSQPRNYRRNVDGKFRQIRHSKQIKEFEGIRMSMIGKQRGLDYTPLFRFLHSKEGKYWNDVHSEAVSRLDKESPIFWLVVNDGRAIVRVGEMTYYHAMFIDEVGILRFVDKSATMSASCRCCTTTLDGKPLKYEKNR